MGRQQISRRSELGLTGQDFQDAITSIERCTQPVICAMYGYALGLAIDIASACDIRVAATDVRMGIQVRLGHLRNSTTGN